MKKSQRTTRPGLSPLAQHVVDAVRALLKEQGTTSPPGCDGGQLKDLLLAAQRRAAQLGLPSEAALSLVGTRSDAAFVMDRAYLHEQLVRLTRRAALAAVSEGRGLAAEANLPAPTRTLVPGRPFGVAPFGTFFPMERWQAAFNGRLATPVSAVPWKPEQAAPALPCPAAHTAVALCVPKLAPIRRAADVDAGWEVASPLSLPATRTMRKAPRPSSRYPEHVRAPASELRLVSSERLQLRCFGKEQLEQ